MDSKAAQGVLGVELPNELSESAIATMESRVPRADDGSAQVVVGSLEQYVHWQMVLRDDIKPRERAIEAFFKPLKDSAWKNHRLICETEEKVLGRVVAVRDVIAQACDEWRQEQKERALAHELELRQQAEQAAQQAVLEQAMELEEAGDTEAAEQLLATPVDVIVPPLPPQQVVPKIPGVSERERWYAVVHDKAKLIAWVAADLPHRQRYLDANMKELNSTAGDQRSTMRIPGVRAESKTSQSWRQPKG